MSFRPSNETIDRQRRASHPETSAWVSANAGSGKTYVLSNRVIRLLLAGHKPSSILCITFTKAAAAHMANTVFRRLSVWATAPDDVLDAELVNLGADRPDSAMRERARRIFARALDTPGGLKIMTIHGFCESLLHQFPFEARVSATFTVVDDREQQEMLAAALSETLAQAEQDATSPVGNAMLRMAADMDMQRLSQLIERELLSKGEELERLMRPHGVLASADVSRRIRAALDEDKSVHEIEREILEAPSCIAGRSEIADWLLSSGKSTDARLARSLQAASNTENLEDRLEAYFDIFLTGDGQERSDKAFITKDLRMDRHDLAELLIHEKSRVFTLSQRRIRALIVQRTEAILHLADAVLTRYRQKKMQRGALDFSDLIHSTRRLLSGTPSSWVHFKLDKGIAHVLVDEAQDTSPEQWDIIRELTSEFTSGAGAQNIQRTMFAVGDEKQSIFGFQGAEPDMFGNMRRRFERLHRESEQNFENVQLNQSFRTARDVLEAVDVVFADEIARKGLTSDDEKTTHDTARPDAPGRVDIWPLERAQKGDPGLPWKAPFDEVSEKDPIAVLADRLARAVKGWISGMDVDGPCTPVPAGEILILVRNRNPLFEAILRKLKEHRVPVAGADRLDLGKHIAVLDLLALADAVLLRENDLALASVLKSPLFGLDDNDLMRLAPQRSASLHAALRAASETTFLQAADKLALFERLAARLRPFDFYASILGAHGGRRAFRARLGHEVDDVLDEFLSYAMRYGESETATLSGFIDWMRTGSAVIKRDLEAAGNDVRVMTVHGAKGLEAEIVVLADIGNARHPSNEPSIFRIKEHGASERDPPLPIWPLSKKNDPDIIADARAEEAMRDAGEHRRLLYVALTRARSRLVVAGHLKNPKHDAAPDNSWYGLVRRALEPMATPIEVPGFDAPVLVYQKNKGRTAEPIASLAATPTPVPDWIFQPLPAEAAPPEAVAPSRALEHSFEPAPAMPNLIPAMERGIFIHRLMEHLPNFAPDTQAAAAHNYLNERASAYSEDARTALAEEALALLVEPQIAALLSKPGRAEVSISGTLERASLPPLLVSGQIDRLIVEETRVLVLDFKSDRPVPRSAPASYVTQLALYRAVLERVFPDKKVECTLLWTADKRLEIITADALDAALQRVPGMAGHS